jgi:TDG/mug DNA glycosylase family protein
MTVLPDVLGPDLAVVFCGTAAGAASRRRGAYYAGPGNRFWPVLAEVGILPRRFAPEEFREVLRYGIGLTDLAQRVSGADAVLRPGDFDVAALRDRLLRFRPRILAFVGKRAAAEFLGRRADFGPQRETLGATAIEVLPSTSGAARGFWDLGPWRDLAARIVR